MHVEASLNSGLGAVESGSVRARNKPGRTGWHTVLPPDA